MFNYHHVLYTTVMEELQTLGKRIKSLRKEKNLTQEELAHESGISVLHLIKIENGKSNPTFETLVKLSKGFDISLSELVKEL